MKQKTKIVYKPADDLHSEQQQPAIQPETGKQERLRAISIKLFGPGLIAGLLAALVAIIVLVVYFISQIGTYKINRPIYRYDTGLQLFHEGNTRLRRRDNLLYLKNGGEETQIQNTPLYYVEQENTLLVPDLMAVIQPGKTVPPVRTPYYTTLSFEDSGIALLQKNKELARVNDGFLFDGKNLYVFMEDMTLQYMGQTIEMPARSYAVVLYNTRIELYPYGGTPVIQQTATATVTAQNKRGTFQLDLSRDIMTDAQGEYLLFSDISLLNEIKPGWPGVS